MNIKQTLVFATIILVVFIYGCSPSYIPNVAQTPMFSNKNEFQGNISIGVSGIDPQAAYSITDNLGVMVNGSFRNSKDSSSFHTHNFLEGGLGYYKTFKDAGRFEVFGGYGFGNVNAKFEADIFNSRANATMNRFFIQPAIGAATDIFDGSFATRVAFVNMNIKENLPDNKIPNTLDVFIEPVITGKIGYKFVKIFMQFGFSLPITKIQVYNYQPFIFAIGLNVKLGKTKTTVSP